jgi:ribosomal protein L16/L10AE
MAEQMSEEMEQQLKTVLAGLQELEIGMWDLVAYTDAAIHCAQMKSARKAVNRRLDLSDRVST